ncbi:MAG TPA: AraC family transcriptional regulator [Gaiellaceae bacterium]|nr:AraC family transcriptional regulator [Gaiellaceae bacterium]
MTAARVERTLHRAHRLRLAEFWCPPSSPRWHVPNVIPGSPHVVFPRTSSVIRHVGGEPTLANAGHVMFYNAGQRYRRRLHDPSGDRCWFVELRPSLLAELGGDGEFRFASGPSDPQARLLLHAAVRHLAADRADALLAEETLLEALSRAVAAAAAFHHSGQSSTPRPAWSELVESAKELLTGTACERLSLDDLARRLHVSEFHLARAFRAGTGMSLHRYRTLLRLELALERLADPETDLARLARELGYASHSHFTDRFRGVFGVPPSAVRGVMGRRTLQELHRVVRSPLRGRGRPPTRRLRRDPARPVPSPSGESASRG